MEIAKLDSSSIKIKGKNATFVVDPSSTLSKTEADGVLVLAKSGSTNFPKLEGVRLVIQAAGEYEIGGVKITGIDAGDSIVYTGDMDGGKFAVGTAEGFEKVLSDLDETPILVLKVTQSLNNSVISTLSPKVCLIYGEGSNQALKVLGKEGSPKMSKYSLKSDKLPEEVEVISLE